jgi:hypothetical protein
MKRVCLYLMFVGAVGFAVSSCSEDYLNIEHYDISPADEMISSEEGLIAGLNGIYDLLIPAKVNATDIEQNWNFKPQLCFANYPALDCQSDSWDYDWMTHSWRPDKDMFQDGWRQSYKSVDRANRFIAQINSVGIEILTGDQQTRQKTKDIMLAEARALRGFAYTWLAQNWGRVPMLKEGETYINTPAKPRAETVEETWNYIVDDFKFAAEHLSWTPWKNQYGRVTKGMAKAYLALAYMYLQEYEEAKTELFDIIKSGIYRLEPQFGNVHKLGQAWGNESIWEVSFPNWPNRTWGGSSTTDALMWWSFMFAEPAQSFGWGGVYVSYEYIRSMEPGDKRLEYSVVQHGELNPYVPEAPRVLPNEWYGSWNMPNNYCIKFWKQQPYPVDQHNPISAIWMRLATIYLNYAECLFRTQGETPDTDGKTGWDYIDMVRERAWGELESPNDEPVGSIQPGLLQVDTKPEGISPGRIGLRPLAKDFYINYKNYKSPSWLVALTVERRHEFLAEYSFWYDLTRTNIAAEYFDNEFPVGTSIRETEYQAYRALMPIPYLEIITNPGIGLDEQNPGYN